MLKQRNVNFEKMFDITKDFRYKISALKKGSAEIISLSETYQSVTGLEATDTRNQTLQEIVHTDDLEKLEIHLEIVRSGRPNTEQYRIKTSDGFITIIDYAKPVWNEQKDAVIEIKGSVSTEISSEAATK